MTAAGGSGGRRACDRWLRVREDVWVAGTVYQVAVEHRGVLEHIIHGRDLGHIPRRLRGGTVAVRRAGRRHSRALVGSGRWLTMLPLKLCSPH